MPLDLTNNQDARQVRAPASIGSNGTTDTAFLDRGTFGSLGFWAEVSAYSDGDFAFSLLEADLANGSDARAPDSAIVIGTPETLSAAGRTKLGYRGLARYVAVRIIATNVSSGATVGVIAALGDPRTAPVSL